MKKHINISTILLITLAIYSSSAQSQADTTKKHDIDESNAVFIQTNNCEVRIPAPEQWTFDLENAAHDNYTAVLIPDSQSYFDHNMIIYIWVLSLDSVDYNEFVSADSLTYLLETDSLEFRSAYAFSDSLSENILPNFIVETADPGGLYNMVQVAYLDLGTDIIILQLDIKDRLYLRDASAAFHEIVSGITCIPID